LICSRVPLTQFTFDDDIAQRPVGWDPRLGLLDRCLGGRRDMGLSALSTASEPSTATSVYTLGAGFRQSLTGSFQLGGLKQFGEAQNDRFAR
jgi:hypothetical protein